MKVITKQETATAVVSSAMKIDLIGNTFTVLSTFLASSAPQRASCKVLVCKSTAHSTALAKLRFTLHLIPHLTRFGLNDQCRLVLIR